MTFLLDTANAVEGFNVVGIQVNHSQRQLEYAVVEKSPIEIPGSLREDINVSWKSND